MNSVMLGLVVVAVGLILAGLVVAVGLGVLVVGRRRERTELAASDTDRSPPGNREPVQRAAGSLIVRHGTNVGQEFLLAGSPIVVGRDPRNSDIALEDSFVSSPHLALSQEDGAYYIVDVASTNGTRVDGVALVPQVPVRLHSGAIIEAGQTVLEFARVEGQRQSYARVITGRGSSGLASAEADEPEAPRDLRGASEPAGPYATRRFDGDN
jgi:hypothetical protein